VGYPLDSGSPNMLWPQAPDFRWRRFQVGALEALTGLTGASVRETQKKAQPAVREPPEPRSGSEIARPARLRIVFKDTAHKGLWSPESSGYPTKLKSIFSQLRSLCRRGNRSRGAKLARGIVIWKSPLVSSPLSRAARSLFSAWRVCNTA